MAAGEIRGRHSGVLLLRCAVLDIDLIELARGMAETLLPDNTQMAVRHLDRWLGSREEMLKV